MLNNQALDIVIGLFFIYALYSLFVTTLTEMIASFLNLRGEVLKEGIMRMLDNDETQIENKGATNKNSLLPENLSQLFFSKATYKYLGRKTLMGKYKHPSYLTPKSFSKSLLDTLGIVHSAKADLSSLIQQLDPGNETHKMIIDLIEQADNNIDQFRELVEEWYDEMMHRVAGWYKRRVQRVTFVIAVLIVFGLNVNTIDIATVLSKNEKARAEMVSGASDFLKSYQAVGDKQDKEQVKDISDITEKVNALINQSVETTSIMNISYPWCSNHPNKSTWWTYILGCFVTVTALSLGAPFWFDLLSKLVKLRSSGTQKKGEEIQSKPKMPVS